MTTAVQHRRGTTAEHAAFTGLEGELTIDTTKDTAVIHDGTLTGGYPLAKENLANVTTSGLSSISGAATASDDKFFIFDQSATSLKTITRAELNNAIEQDALANVAITGGTINGTTIGGTTAAGVSATTLSASSTVTFTGLSASQAVFTNASDQLVSNAITGTGNVVMSTSPTLVTPVLGTPSSATLTFATGLPISTGVSGLGTGVATFLATPSSANLAAAVTGETGTGALVFGTSPTITGGTVNPTTLQEGSVAAMIQTDIGTAPNEIPLNQYLGNLAYQDAANIAGPVGVGGALDVAGNAVIDGSVLIATNTQRDSEKLTVDQKQVIAGTTSFVPTLKFFNTTSAVPTSDSTIAQLEFHSSDTSNPGVSSFIKANTDTVNQGVLVFGTGVGGSATERARINSAGNVGVGTASPSASAILDVQSTTKGVRMPNMTTTQKNAIASPAAGLMVFDTTLAKLSVYSGVAWETITSL